MSGPEWTPEHSNAPAEPRPMSGVGAEGSPHPAPPTAIGSNPFPPERARGVPPEQVERDDAAAQANLDADEATAGPGKVAALLGSLRAMIAHLWNRRRKPDRPEVDYDQSAAPATGPTPDPTEPAPTESAEPRRAPRWSPASWTWETRVGVAAVLSFLILVGVFVVKKGWVGGRKSAVLTALPTKPKNSDKPENPPKLPGEVTSPPAPNVHSGGDHLAENHHGTEAQPAPLVPPAGGLLSAGSEPPPTVETLAPPTGGDLAPPPSLGNNPATAAASDPSKPPDLPGTGDDAPPLPTIPAAGGLATLPGTAETKEEPPAKPPEADVKTAEVPAKPPEADVKTAEVPTKPPEADVKTAEAPPAASPADPPPEPVVVPPADPTPTTAQPKADPASPVAEEARLQPAKVRNLEVVPTPAPDAPAPSKGPDWVVIPSGGKRPGAAAPGDPGIGIADDVMVAAAPRRSRGTDGPPVADEPAAGAGEVLHTVRPDENFWTISKDFYNSGRYYKALHKANAKQVPDIKKLYVGTVIRIPPPEALDRTLVERTMAEPMGTPIDGPAVSRTSSSKSTDADSGAESAMPPPRSTRPGLRRARSEPVEAPRRPSYRVKPNDTLRSIARDTLDDSGRASEIYNLNRDVLDGPKAPLTPGTSLTLPDDAVIGRAR